MITVDLCICLSVWIRLPSNRGRQSKSRRDMRVCTCVFFVYIQDFYIGDGSLEVNVPTIWTNGTADQSQNVKNTPHSDHFWNWRCRKSARRCGAKHMSKSRDGKSTPRSDHFWTFKCHFSWQATLHLQLHYTTPNYTTPTTTATTTTTTTSATTPHNFTTQKEPQPQLKLTLQLQHYNYTTTITKLQLQLQLQLRCATPHYTTLH